MSLSGWAPSYLRKLCHPLSSCAVCRTLRSSRKGKCKHVFFFDHMASTLFILKSTDTLIWWDPSSLPACLTFLCADHAISHHWEHLWFKWRYINGWLRLRMIKCMHSHRSTWDAADALILDPWRKTKANWNAYYIA